MGDVRGPMEIVPNSLGSVRPGLMNRLSWSGQVIKVGWSKCPLPAVVILIISIAEIVKTQDGWGEWSGQDDQ